MLLLPLRFQTSPKTSTSVGGLEHIPTQEDAERYLHDVRARLRPSRHGKHATIFSKNLEEFLQHERNAAHDDTHKAMVRGLIRAVSWHRYPRTTHETLIAGIKQEHAQTTDAQTHMRWQSVLDGLRLHLCGEDAEPATRAIEDLIEQAYARHNNKQYESWRPIRDQLYMQRLYPTWCGYANPTKNPRSAR